MTDALFQTPAVAVAPVAATAGTTPAAHALGAAGALPVAPDPGDGSGTAVPREDGEASTGTAALQTHATRLLPTGANAGPAGGETAIPVAEPAGPATHNVIGVDLSLTCTGIASLHGAISIESTGKKNATLGQRQQRLRRLRARIITAVGRHGDPDLIVIEAPSYGSRNAGSTHDRSGLWWLLIDVFTIRGWRVIEVAPSSRMKYATGKGLVGKDVVLAAAIKRLPIDVTNGDEADAAWLCAIGHDLLNQPLCPMPAAHRTALDVVRTRLAESE